MELTQEYLKSILDYDPETGLFTNKIMRSPRALTGEVAGTLNGRGYIQIGINGKRYIAHRLAFLYVEGELPPEDVDHINGNRTDNRWQNLRHANKQTNGRNTKRYITNTSGIMGVSWCAPGRKWASHIKVSGRTVYLGYFTTKFAAAYARHQAELKFNFHPSHGRVMP